MNGNFIESSYELKKQWVEKLSVILRLNAGNVI